MRTFFTLTFLATLICSITASPLPLPLKNDPNSASELAYPNDPLDQLFGKAPPAPKSPTSSDPPPTPEKDPKLDQKPSSKSGPRGPWITCKRTLLPGQGKAKFELAGGDWPHTLESLNPGLENEIKSKLTHIILEHPPYTFHGSVVSWGADFSTRLDRGGTGSYAKEEVEEILTAHMGGEKVKCDPA